MNGLLDLLTEYAASDQLPMHMPGHKRRGSRIQDPCAIDITEIPGFDDLHHAEGILLEAQKRAAELYHSEETHYLINGSTAGILAAVSGCTSFGGKILMARNCHRSVYHGVLLRGLESSYLYPHSTGDMGINGVILPEDVEKRLEEDAEIQAVVITSPTYDGVVPRVGQIAEIVHAHGIPLIVDEAHGAHFPFSEELPEDSVSCGADVVIHSLHKTLPSLTQTALIHLNGPRICREKIRKYLTVYQTSSPSYVLMAGIDECVSWIRSHREKMDFFLKEIRVFRDGLSGMKRLKLLHIPGMDPSRILISVRGAGLSGMELSEMLREHFHIQVEMACSTYVCAITTVWDTGEDLERLKTALLEIDRMQTEHMFDSSSGKRSGCSDEVLVTEHVCTLLEAEDRDTEYVDLKDSVGRISGDFVVLYPPGIPILAPGEIITSGIGKRLGQYAEARLEVHGMEHGQIQVLKEGMTGNGWKSDCI